MAHGKVLSGPAQTPTTVKDFRRVAGRMEDRARYLRMQRHTASRDQLTSIMDRIALAEHNARIIRQRIQGLPDHLTLEISPSL